jgi:hypothetical protein
MRNESMKYCAETELDRGARLSAVSYDKTQRAMVTDGRATVGGKAVTAEITGIATGKGLDGTVNMWLPGFSFQESNGAITQVPGFNAVATLLPHQGAIDTAKAIACRVNTFWKPYKAKTGGDRKTAWITIAFTGKKLHRPAALALA